MKAKDEKTDFKQYWLWLTALAFGFGSLGLYKPILGPYLKQLGYSASVIGFTIGLLGLSKSLTNIPAGYFSDKIGRKPVALVGMVALAVCFPFYIISKNIYVLSIARIIQGFGNSAAAQATMTAAADLLSKRRALAMGLLESINYVALTLCTLLAGYVAKTYGIVTAFYLGPPICLIGILIMWKFARETKPEVSDPPASTVNTVVCPDSDPEYKKPMDVWKKLLKNPGFASMCYLGFMCKMTDEGILVTLIPLIAIMLGFNVAQIGGIMAMGYATFSLVQPVTGFVSDKIGRKPMFFTGLLLMAGATYLFPYAKEFWIFSAVVVMLKFGNALLYPVLPAAAADLSPIKFRSTGISIYRVFRDAGVFGGPIIAGLLLDYMGKVNSFYFLSAMFIMGIILTLAFVKETLSHSSVH